MTTTRGQQLALLLVAIVALVAALQRPTIVLPGQTYRHIYVFDISQSMNVMDVELDGTPLRRLEAAKRHAIESLARLPCDAEVGVALFTGHRPFLLLTPVEICENYLELATIIDRIEWRMTWKARSEIAKGLYKSIELVPHLEHPTRVVFFTDGHESPPVNPELEPRFWGQAGEVLGLVVGVGGDEPVPIPRFLDSGEPNGFYAADDVPQGRAYRMARNASGDGDRIAVGTEHLSSVREFYLQGLAEKTGLTYHRLGTAEELIEALTRRTLGIDRPRVTDLRPFFGVVALIVLVLMHVSSAGSRREAVTESSDRSALIHSSRI